MNKYFTGTGRRKTASATVKISKGKGELNINNTQSDAIDIFAKPLKVIEQVNEWDINAIVHGGGAQSQKDALQLAITHALIKYDNNLKATFRKHKLISTDSRKKERKKPGLKKARKAPQWSKR